jgi:hypothetical protein
MADIGTNKQLEQRSCGGYADADWDGTLLVFDVWIAP